MTRRTILPALLLFSLAVPLFPSQAQQIEAIVTVNDQSIGTSNRDLLQNFKPDIEAYLNGFRWNEQGNTDDKIKCNFDIFIQSVVGENRYSAQVFVGSRRQIYNSDKASAVLRIFDESWTFTYVKDRPISHSPYTFSDLTSVLDFYVYVILGYDYDTYDKLAGSPYLRHAADVANLGRSSGQSDWSPSKSGYSRIQFADELNDAKFNPVRVASYIYHFEGLDSLGVNMERGRSNILRALDLIAKIKATVDPRNIVIKSFFDTKFMELSDLFLTYPDPAIYIKLSTLDPNHQKTYEEYRVKRQGG